MSSENQFFRFRQMILKFNEKNKEVNYIKIVHKCIEEDPRDYMAFLESC